MHGAPLGEAGSKLRHALQQIDPLLSSPILIEALRLPRPEVRAAAAAALASAPTKWRRCSIIWIIGRPDVPGEGKGINSLTTIFGKSQCLPADYEEAEVKDCVER